MHGKTQNANACHGLSSVKECISAVSICLQTSSGGGSPTTCVLARRTKERCMRMHLIQTVHYYLIVLVPWNSLNI